GRDELLRIRVETPTDRSGPKRTRRFVLTFKGPVKEGGSDTRRDSSRLHGYGQDHKVREEIELEVGDQKALGLILTRLGMAESFHYEKYRTTFRLPTPARWAKGLVIELDETPIGNFVELEGPSKAIDRAAKLLGFSKDDYVVTNYLRLYAEECTRRGEKVGDMVFRKQK
ncbi:MAG: class IV adenylate cyclase, partial [Acidobacteria bacterium]|nr:class IV adenylate cyclase [Acidobacteriota bacterium]